MAAPPAGGEQEWDGLNNFTPRARQALRLAREEAGRLNHNFIGTEHVLLGLIRLGQGTAVNVLTKMGLDLETLRSEVKKQVGVGPGQAPWSSPLYTPYTPRLIKVLALAAHEAKALNHTYVGTEHILLGLLREGDGVAGRVLTNLHVQIEEVRQAILRELDPSLPPWTGEADRSERPQSTDSLEPSSDSVDTSKRYDVYCSERHQGVIVYRNALFKGAKTLLQEGENACFSDFVELEQADGQRVFVARSSIIKFCPSLTPPPTPGGKSP